MEFGDGEDELSMGNGLAEELDQAEDISRLVAYNAYELPTPYGTVGGAKALLQALQTADANPE